MFLTEIFDEQFIAVALFTTQMEIAMSCLDTIAQITKDAQKRYAVGPTAERHNVNTVVGQKLMLRDEIGNFINHCH